jgi:hypothetical protein
MQNGFVLHRNNATRPASVCAQTWARLPEACDVPTLWVTLEVICRALDPEEVEDKLANLGLTLGLPWEDDAYRAAVVSAVAANFHATKR